MSVFPFTDPTQFEVTEKEVPLAKEYAYDFYKGDFLFKNCKPYLVEGNEAIKIWITKALLTSRYKEIIHTWGYGSEFEEKLIGRGYSSALVKTEAERYVKECIYASLSDYVKDLRDFEISFIDNTLNIVFTVDTIYGEVNADVQL